MKVRSIAAGVLALFTFRVAGQISDSQMTPRIRDLLKARRYADAEQLLQRDLGNRPGWEAGHLLLAQICVQTGQYQSAEHSAAAALRIRESVEALLLLATADMHLSRLDDSIGWLERAARLRPDLAEVYKLLGMDYALGGVMREAEKAFRKATELAVDNWENSYFDGRALFELGRFSEALGPLTRAARLNTGSVKAWTALGQVQERLGNGNAAEESYGKALELCGTGPDCAWPLMQLGYRCTLQTNFQEALLFFKRAVRAKPDWARPHFHLGKALARLNYLEGARHELEQAIRLDATPSEYHYQLAQVYRQLGEDEKARAEFALFRTVAQASRGMPDSGFAAQP